MAQYDITTEGDQLIIKLIIADEEFSPNINTLKNPSIKLTSDRIKFFDSGVYNVALFFNQINEIGGEAPSDLEDAADKIIALIGNFNGGGIAPTNILRSSDANITLDSENTPSTLLVLTVTGTTNNTVLPNPEDYPGLVILFTNMGSGNANLNSFDGNNNLYNAGATNTVLVAPTVTYRVFSDGVFFIIQ